MIRAEISNEALVADSIAELNLASASVDWLAISPDDSMIVERLEVALTGKSAAILKTQDVFAKLIDSEFQASIDQAVQESEISHVILVGSSLDTQSDSASGEPAGSQAEMALPEDMNAVASRLLAGASSQTVSNQAGQKLFAAEVTEFVKSGSLQKRWNGKSIAIYGLYYRDCDGVFMLYNPETEGYSLLSSIA